MYQYEDQQLEELKRIADSNERIAIALETLAKNTSSSKAPFIPPHKRQLLVKKKK